jgi:hypothetical protein
VLIEGNLDQGRGSVADERVALLVVGVLKELLAEVVAKRILKEVSKLSTSRGNGE